MIFEKVMNFEKCADTPAPQNEGPTRTPMTLVKGGDSSLITSTTQASEALMLHSRLAQSSFPPLAPGFTEGKRPSDSEVGPAEGHPDKHQRRVISSFDPSKEVLTKDSKVRATAAGSKSPAEQSLEPLLLSERDWQSLQSLYKDVKDLASYKVSKRTSSRRSLTQSETLSDFTQSSSITTTAYRHHTLAAVKIHLHAEPPEEIETAINNIFNTKIPEQRRGELEVIATEFHTSCFRNVRAQSGEDDFVAPLQSAIMALSLKQLCIRQKAGWKLELKPMIPRQQTFSTRFIANVQQPAVDNSSTSPSKRQQRCSDDYTPPESLGMTTANPSTNIAQKSGPMPPPVRVPPKEDRSPVKTPYPDLTIGIDRDALISALASRDLNEYQAAGFVEWIQEEMVQYEPGGTLQPALIIVPAVRALDLAFPFFVAEGKAYSTGKQIFEAENQAAGAMACAHNILYRLNCMAGTTDIQSRVLFSITTQGPLHELWAHWVTVKGGLRVYESKLLDSSNALLPERAANFITKLYSVCVWGTGPFMNSVVEALGKVAVQAMAQ